MNRFVIAFPLNSKSTGSSSLYLESLSGWPKPWLDYGRGLTRQVAKLGNRSFSTARVCHFQIELSGLSFSPTISIETAIQVMKKNVFNQLILIGNIAEGHEASLNELRSVGSAKTRTRIQELFGLEIDDSDTVFATTVFATGATDQDCKNGLLVSNLSNAFAFDVINSLVVSAISAERIILEKATETIFQSDFFALKSRRQLSRLYGWISVPSSDSSRLIQDILKLRLSLQLTERTEQVSKVLSNRTRAVDLSIATFLGTLGFTSTFFGNYTSYFEPLSLNWYQALGLSSSLSLLVSIITFLILWRR